MHAEYDFSDESKGSMSVHLVYEGDKKAFPEVPDLFKGKRFEAVFLAERKAYIISLGPRDKIILDYYRRAAARSAKVASYYKFANLHFSVHGLSAEHCVAIFEGAFLANYSFDKYKAEAERVTR